MRHAVCNVAGRTRKSARFGQGSAATSFSPAAGFLASQLTPPGSQGRGLMTLVNGEMQAQFMARIRGLDPQRCQSSPRRSVRGQPHRLRACVGAMQVVSPTVPFCWHAILRSSTRCTQALTTHAVRDAATPRECTDDGILAKEDAND